MADEISVKVRQIDAAIDWENLSPEKNEALTKAKMELLSKISFSKLEAESGRVGHYVDVQEITNKICHAFGTYLSVVEQTFPYWNVNY
ncbi:MAG: hypothetical protein IJU81_01315 [Bacteroidales bacterium]|nr:hypothetical protein [Bacteroidales bacterium]